MQGALRRDRKAPLAIAIVLFATAAATAASAAAAAGTADAVGPDAIDSSAVEGRVRALAPALVHGSATATLDGDGLLLMEAPARTPVSVALAAPELTLLVYRAERSCVAAFPGAECVPFQTQEYPVERVPLTDAVVVTTGAARDGFRAAVSLRDEHFATDAEGDAGTLTLRHGTAAEPARLGVPGAVAGFHAGADPQGRSSSPQVFSAPNYKPHEGQDVFYDAREWDAAGTGRLQLFLRGVDVDVKGTTEDGEAFDHSIRTGESRDTDGATETRTVEFVILEAGDANLLLRFDGVGTMAGFPTVESEDRVVLERATGEVASAAGRETYEDETADVRGRLTLTPVRYDVDKEAKATWLTLDTLDGEALVQETVAPAKEPRDLAEVASGAAAGAAVFGALGAVVAAGYYWPTLKFGLTALLAPLYSRIERDDVLDHTKREEIYGLIRSAPGIHAHEISTKANIGWGTTVYHLRLLESHHLVVSKRSGRYKRFFLNSGAVGAKKDAYGVLRNDTAARLGQFVLKNPGVSQKEVCVALGISPSLVSWHVDRLEEADLVKKVKEGRRVRYFAGPAWNDINMAVLPVLAAGAAGGAQSAGAGPGAAVADGGEAS